jgi:hypothetical protein
MTAQYPRFLLIPAIILYSASSLRGDPAGTPPCPPPNRIIADGEDLMYEVRWTFFKLGTIRLLTHGDYSAEAYIHSYEGLPFVDLHTVHFTLMDSCFFSRGSRSLEKKGSEWWGEEYLYDTADSRLYVKELFKKDYSSPPYKSDVRDTIQLRNMLFLDGVSIGFYPRASLHRTDTVTVPTVLYGKLGATTFRFPGRPTTETIDADPQPIRVVEVTGATTVEGVYGMTGEFTGWFSDDDAAVPIKGKVKVLIGNVTVELIKWNRKGWSPPH